MMDCWTVPVWVGHKCRASVSIYLGGKTTFSKVAYLMTHAFKQDS